MSGRTSPFQAGEDAALPQDIYVNPDPHPETIPVAGQIPTEEDDNADMAPARSSRKKGGLKKMGDLFKKGKEKLKGKKTKQPTVTDVSPNLNMGGTSQLAEVFGKTGGSSISSGASEQRQSVEGGYDTVPKKTKVPRLESFKGLFHKSPKTTEPFEERGFNSHQGTGHEQYGETKMGAMRSSFRNFFRGPPAPSPPVSPDSELQVAPLHPRPPKPCCRTSITIIVMLVLLIIVGIILLIAGRGGGTRTAVQAQMMGPCFLGLGIFVLIGHIWFMLFWRDDPLPMLNSTMAKINAKIGAIPDPYGHKAPRKQERASYYPGLRMSAYVNQGPASPPIRDTVTRPQSFQNVSYDSYQAPGGPWGASPPGAAGPLGPAALNTSGPGGPAALGRPYRSQESLDMRLRTGETPSPGFQNSSYQPEDSYQPDDSYYSQDSRRGGSR